jgi:hypothetical protein
MEKETIGGETAFDGERDFGRKETPHFDAEREILMEKETLLIERETLMESGWKLWIGW